MKYISKGLVAPGSTERRLRIMRCGCEFMLTGDQAAIWLNGRLGFSQIDEDNSILMSALTHLKRMELVEIAQGDAGEYYALTGCIIVPAKAPHLGGILTHQEKTLLKWIQEAGMHLTMAELVFLSLKDMQPEPQWLGEENRQRLTETIYTQTTIQDNILEAQMEHAECRNKTVRCILSLLKKKRILLL